ncbi:MAG: penicillin-binding protein 2 [Leptospiraceae bacterium]|nr:penicillin-binding protein 2 [Leptospiraceae bacterium]MCB1320816.1 penicillin-binding protein 2 [Leptospiraceae bacterium]
MAKSLFEYRIEKKFQTRLYVFAAIVFLVAATFVIQLGNLQLVQGAENRVRARRFVSRQEYTIAPRGLMFDRNYKPGDEPLVQNIRFIDFVIFPARFSDLEALRTYVAAFCRLMERDYETFAAQLSEDSFKEMSRKNESITLLTRVTRAEQERLAEFHIADRFGEFVPNHLRYYTMGPALAHVTGYIGMPSRRDLDTLPVQSYQTVGKAGIEREYDEDLRGRDGIRLRHIVIDSEEQVASTQQGNNLILTIDRRIQTAAYNAISRLGKRGTAIAMNAATGQVLALVSYPTFDPNILSSGSNRQRSDHLEEVRIHQGFLNRAIQAKSPPASTIKPLVALAALENTPGRDITPNTTYSCYGRYVLKSTRPGVPDSIYACWSTHGTNNLEGAIAHSCNVYFYNLGYRMGSLPMIDFARKFGFDRPTGIDLPGEISGFVPDSRWKQERWGSKWYDGDTVNFAIGQGFLQQTPMELAVMYSALVNRGKILRPYLIREVRDPDNRVIRRINPNGGRVEEVPISMASLRAVQKGLRAAVTYGTSRRLSVIPVPIAGKTGTAQTRSSRTASSHAWFAGFAPYGAPPEDTIVVVVFVEHGQGGSAAAAPIAGEIFQAAFPDWSPLKSRELEMNLYQLDQRLHDQQQQFEHLLEEDQQHEDHADHEEQPATDGIENPAPAGTPGESDQTMERTQNSNPDNGAPNNPGNTTPVRSL